MATVVTDDAEFFQDGPALPQDRPGPTSPGPDLDPESADPQPQPLAPAPDYHKVATVGI